MMLFEADWVCPVSSAPISGGAVRVENGRIAGVVTAAEAAGIPGERTRFNGCAIIPGFVNAHVHLELTLLRGLLEDLDFFSWIRTVTQISSKDCRATRSCCRRVWVCWNAWRPA